ncbi:MAG: hypothetical protein IJD80_03365 [Oscillospiraceae bacterium]|nr:hypothetical protein [Oscillospiraceae bacterium]
MENDVYRGKPERKRRINWLPLIFILFIGLYAFLQAYLMNANGVDTVKAAEGYINDSIISQGIICREEIVLTRTSTGVVDYLVEDGERISKGYLLASVYPSYTDIRNLTHLRNRQSMLEDIQSAAVFLDTGTVDMAVTKKQLSSQLSGLSQLSNGNDFSKTNDNLADLTLTLNKISVATGRTTDFNKAETQLKGEIAARKASVSSAQDNLYSSYTGYFLQSSDGYEKIATVDNFLNMSYEEGINIINGSGSYVPAENEYGKIFTDYKWSLCTYVDTAMAENLYVGKKISVSIDVNQNEYQKATVEHLIPLGEKTLVVMQCTNMSSQSAKSRIVDCEILFKQYNGIKIPKAALHFDGDQMGVYVNFSNLVQFKKITPVYEDENYIVIPVEYSSENQVKLHDSIIVKGRNLYDGKYL